MISISKIWAVTLRYLRLFKWSPNYIIGTLYWPLLDIAIWGFVGIWLEGQKNANIQPHYAMSMLLGVLLWQLVGRGGRNISICFIEELWSNNIVNMFCMPLHLSEWLLGIFLYYVIVISAVITLSMSFIYMTYSIDMVMLIRTFFIFLPPLLLCAVWIGFMCLQVLVLVGKRGLDLGFFIAWCLLPFSGAYYPTHVLPAWMQRVSDFLPLKYIFDGMRVYVLEGKDPAAGLCMGYLLGLLYAIIGLMLFVYCFNRSKQYGLARLTD